MQQTQDAPESVVVQGGAAEARAWPAWSWWVVGAAVTLHALLAWLVRPAGVMTGQDDGVYLMLARELRSLSYHDQFMIGAPRHGLYPPGYPTLLSLWGLLTGDSFAGAVLLGVMLSGASLVVVWLLFRSQLPLAVALAGVVALALNPNLVAFASSIASEAPYLFVSALAIWLASRDDGRGRAGIALIGLAVFAALTRAVGLTLVIAFGLAWLVWGPRRRALMLAVAGVLIVGPWFLWIATVPDQVPGQSYVADAMFQNEGAPSPIAVVAERVGSNAPRYFGRSLPHTLAAPTVPGTPIDNGLLAVLFTVGTASGVWLLWRRRRLESLYIVCYMGLLLVWPWAVSRFLFPVLPFLLGAVLLSLTAFSQRLAGWRSVAAPVGLALLLAGGGAAQTIRLVAASDCVRGGEMPHPSCLSPDQASFFEAVRFIRSELPADARILTAKGEPLWYYTGRRTISPPLAMADGADGVLPLLERRGVEYVLLGSLRSWETGVMNDVLEENCTRLDLLASFPPRTLLFRIRATELPVEVNESCTALAEYRRLNADRDFAAGT